MERISIRIFNWYSLYALTITGLFVLVYHQTLIWMWSRFFSADSYYSHGFFVPFVVAFLIWYKRETLKKTEIGYSKYGLLLIAASLVIHLISSLFYVYSSSGFSILLLILGISLFIFGKEVTKVILFPLLFLLFMFPIPEAFISALATPMKMNVGRLATFILSQVGYPVYREGYYIITAKGELLIGNPCSGLRSIISFLGLGSLFAYFLNASKLRKFIFVILSIPIALGINALRVIALVLVTHYYGSSKASPDSFFHDFSGVMAIVIGFVILYGVGKVIECKPLR